MRTKIEDVRARNQVIAAKSYCVTWVVRLSLLYISFSSSDRTCLRGATHGSVTCWDP